MNPPLLGALRGLGVAVLIAILSWLGNAANLPFLNPETATLVAAVALAIEHQIEAKTGKALFGAARLRR
jgi:hypothetical protein